MSGPATAAFSFAPLGAIALAAMALREAHQMGREYQDAFEEIQNRSLKISNARYASQQARIEERKALRTRALQAESQLERFRGLLAGVESNIGVRFEHGLPDTMEQPLERLADGWHRHMDAVQAEIGRIQEFIRQHHVAAKISEFQQPEEEVVPIEEALHIYMMHRAMNAHLDSTQSDAVKQMVSRILSRLNLAPGEPVPVDLDQLAKSIVLAPDLARAESLSMELRLQVQHQRDARAAQLAGVQEAQKLLAEMADQAPHAVQLLLEDVAAGERTMDAQVRELAHKTLETIESQRKQLQEEAAAEVLKQSLRDLGYEVEGVENTFFIEGGVAHFQRHGWGEYFVRMRVGVEDKTLNFNVVRAKGAQETAERRRVDALAEDRWCSEFPKLLETLAARGITLDVKRLLGAGELPVQVVEASTLPAAETRDVRAAKGKLQELKR